MNEPTYYTCTDQRMEQSQIELEVVRRLTALGLPIIPQVKLNNWIFDGAVDGTLLLVEIHGDYWHNRPEVQERDQRKKEWADIEGYTIWTIWEADYKKAPDTLLVQTMELYALARAAAAPQSQSHEGDKGDTPAPISAYGDWRDRFLTQLAFGGVVREACLAAGVSRKTAYEHRIADKAFANDWKLALQDAADLALAEYRKRGMQQSDRAMEFFIKSRDPETYPDKNRVEVTGKDGQPVEHVHMTLEEWRAQAAQRLDAASGTYALLGDDAEGDDDR